MTVAREATFQLSSLGGSAVANLGDEGTFSSSPWHASGSRSDRIRSPRRRKTARQDCHRHFM